MSFKQHLAANRWLRAELAVLLALVAYMPLLVVLATSPAWAAPPVLFLMAAGGVCWRGARRVDAAIAAAKQRNEAEARTLRAPRAPTAGPDQCPVCGGYGLNDLAADDAFMERGPDRAKVVTWGIRRAHRDCAEMVPYVAPPSTFHCPWCGRSERAHDDEERTRLAVAHAECEREWGGVRALNDMARERKQVGKLRASIGMGIVGLEIRVQALRVEALRQSFDLDREALERLRRRL